LTCKLHLNQINSDIYQSKSNWIAELNVCGISIILDSNRNKANIKLQSLSFLLCLFKNIYV